MQSFSAFDLSLKKNCKSWFQFELGFLGMICPLEPGLALTQAIKHQMLKSLKIL